MMTANWKLFRKWDVEEKGRRLRSLSPQDAFAIFAELYSLQESLPSEELEKSRQRRLQNLIGWRKTMDSLKKKLG